jgi:hypothetical protein
VIEERFENEEEIRRFLLGAMSADERAAFEARFIAEDSDLFDRIGVVEDELIESYVRETLSPSEKAKFEQSFLNSETRRARVAFKRALFEKISAESLSTAKKTEAAAEKPAVWNSLLNLFKTPRFALGAAFAVLVLGFGFWVFVFRKTENGGELVRQATPTPFVAETPQNNNQNAAPLTAVNVNSANDAETNKTPTVVNAENSNKPQPKETAPQPAFATLALFSAGTVRSEGKTSELNLTKDTASANFVLNLESSDYKTYRAEIVDADGVVVYRSGRLTARKRAVNAYFPTARLKRGDYLIKLYGLSAAGEEESAADFQFRVNRK